MEKILTQKVVLNPNYILCPDKDRVLLTYSKDTVYKLFNQFIHPMHAILFSFFKGDKTLKSCIIDITEYFSIPFQSAFELIKPFINNTEEVSFNYDNNNFTIPKRLIVTNTNSIVRNDLDEQNFYLNPPYDFKRKRLSIPRFMLFVINTSCVTDCMYCYADRKTKYTPLPLQRILEIIEDAKKSGIASIDLSGGEVLLHRDHIPIIKKLLECGYKPEISTKVPLSNEKIDQLAAIGLNAIQISLDSINSSLLQNTLGVGKDYCEKMKQAIKYFDKKGFEVIIKGTQTKDTYTIDNISEIVSFLNTLNNVSKYTISVAGYSHYKPLKEYILKRPTAQQIEVMSDYIQQQESKLKYRIIDDNQARLSNELCNYSEFKGRSLCTANVDGLILLPDGKVTICEELYWNPDFIIGDLSKDSIQEVWDSPKAYSLWALSKEVFPDNSPCKKCQDFTNCRQGLGVCWKEIIAAYGNRNYLFPDPRCPKAPLPTNKYYYNN